MDVGGKLSARGLRLEIASLWDGRPCRPEESASVTVSRGQGGLEVVVEAPEHGDPAPMHACGSTPGLWAYEVVELFVASASPSTSRPYLELEFGPLGHYLVLCLEGVRQVRTSGLSLDVHWQREEGRWMARTCVPNDYLPPAPWCMNAYAIHGVGTQRRYLAWAPVPGVKPDFHQPTYFRSVELPLAVDD